MNLFIKVVFLLASYLGYSYRSSIDLDCIIVNSPLIEEKIMNKFSEILKEKDGDDITYEIIGIKNIREDDEYGGYSLSILCKLDNIREKVTVDIATGDPITPSEITHIYKSPFTGGDFSICAYNFETILAEKIQTLY